MESTTQRIHARRFSFMFALFVIMAFSSVDAQALSRNQASKATQRLAAIYCHASVPRGFYCRFKSDFWVFKHTTEVRTRRAGPFIFQKAYSKARYVWAMPGNSFGIEYGCETLVGQHSFGFPGNGMILRNCTDHRRPRMIGIVRLPGGYHR